MSTNLLIKLVEQKLNDCDMKLAAMRETTRDLNSDFTTFGNKLNRVNRWLKQTKEENDMDFDDDDDEKNGLEVSSIMDSTSISMIMDRGKDSSNDELEERNHKEMIQRILDYASSDYVEYDYEERNPNETSYVNLTIRSDGIVCNKSSHDRFSFISDADVSLASSSFSSSSSGYSTS